MSVLTDFEGFFETEEEFVLYLGDGRLSSPPSPSLSSLFLTSKIIFLQKQRLSNWRSLLWMVLTLVLVTHLPVPVGFSSGRFFVYFKAEILILRRSFFSLRWVCLSLWARSRTIRAQYKPPGKINISPFTFSYSNIRTTTTNNLLSSTTTYMNMKPFLGISK